MRRGLKGPSLRARTFAALPVGQSSSADGPDEPDMQCLSKALRWLPAPPCGFRVSRSKLRGTVALCA
eukprot:5843809-Alexandrium_andersonii.AAC.1